MAETVETNQVKYPDRSIFSADNEDKKIIVNIPKSQFNNVKPIKNKR